MAVSAKNSFNESIVEGAALRSDSSSMPIATRQVCLRRDVRPLLRLPVLRQTSARSRRSAEAAGREEGLPPLPRLRREGVAARLHRAAAQERSRGSQDPDDGRDGHAPTRHAGAGANPDRPHDSRRRRGEPNLPPRDDVRLRHRWRSGVSKTTTAEPAGSGSTSSSRAGTPTCGPARTTAARSST